MSTAPRTCPLALIATAAVLALTPVRAAADVVTFGIRHQVGISQGILNVNSVNEFGGTSSATFGSGGSVPLTVGNFYQLTATFQHTGTGNQFNVTGRLEDFGTNGTTNLGAVLN